MTQFKPIKNGDIKTLLGLSVLKTYLLLKLLGPQYSTSPYPVFNKSLPSIQLVPIQYLTSPYPVFN